MKAWLMLALGATLFVPGPTQAATPLLGVGMAKYDDNFQTLLRNGVQQQAGVMNADIFMENGKDSVDLQMRHIPQSGQFQGGCDHHRDGGRQERGANDAIGLAGQDPAGVRQP